MSTQKLRAYLGRALTKLAIPFRLDRATIRDLPTASARPRPLDVLLRWFGKDDYDCKLGADDEMRLLEAGTTSDADTQTPGWGSDLYQYKSEECPRLPTQCESGRQIGTSDQGLAEPNDNEFIGGSKPSSEALEGALDESGPQIIQYPSENQVVLVDGLVSFLLTKETIDDLHQIFVADRNLEHFQIAYDEAEAEAKIGQSFIKNAESQINDPSIPEQIRSEIYQDLEQQRPRILMDIQRQADLEQELSLQTCNQKYSRRQVDQIFKNIMADAGIVGEPENAAEALESPMMGRNEEPGNENDKVFEGFEQGIADLEPHTSSGNPLRAPDSLNADVEEKNIAREEHIQAYNNLQLAEELFNQRQEAYNRDIAEHVDSSKYSREDIDLFHVKLGAELTRNFMEAEEEFERTRTRAKALDILVNSVVSGSESDDYRESEDRAQHADMVDRNFIESWMSDVAAAQDLPSSPLSSKDWDAKTVNISDSCSVICENPKQRRLIDRWHAEQASLRERIPTEME